ncbi:uncharacterized protein [Palaemon carinicauda]|uniref:uncharacterized protein n=1 Tax=Palaemon carinicauda TaxID=392227 RepID=UPI0035B5E9C2
MRVQGAWSNLFKSFHINFLETMDVLLTLKKVSPHHSTHIRLVLDSEVVVRCLNRQGSRLPQINQVMLAIFLLAESKKWYLSAVYIQGLRNVTPDALSRFTPIDSEWSLDAGSFSFISSQVPELQIDFFATKYNKKIECYVSPYEEPLAEAVDAMSLDWNIWSRSQLIEDLQQEVVQREQIDTGPYIPVQGHSVH